LVADSSLESGTGWTMKTNGRYAMLSNIQAHSGSKSAYLAGANQAADLLSTKLVVPTGGQSTTLDFWWKVNSEDNNDTSDQLTVQVANNSGKIQTVLLVLGSSSASNQWQQSRLDMDDFAGQSIQLQFVAETDEKLVTDFFIDDINLLTCSAAQ